MVILNSNNIFFTYDTARDSLILNGADGQCVPMFNPDDIICTLRKLAFSPHKVNTLEQVHLSNGKCYRMEITSDDPAKLLRIVLSETV